MDSLSFPSVWFWSPTKALCGFLLAYSALSIIALHFKPQAPSPASEAAIQSALDGAEETTPLDHIPASLTLNALCVQSREARPLRSSYCKDVVGPISANFQPGTMTAILGPSGSGKTTLLETMCGHLGGLTRRAFSQTGSILLNGHRATTFDVRLATSFVPQREDSPLHNLTVRETLQFAAHLRLPAHLNASEKLLRSNIVLAQLGLKSCADTVVGHSGLRGISGGEKRRLSIAVQLLTNPSILVLDEPTSGLDAFTASMIVQALRKLADEGRTVIMVVHQPRWAFMRDCDQILLLSRQGRQAFSGSADQLQAQLSNTCVASMSAANPADTALDLLADGVAIRGTHQNDTLFPASPISGGKWATPTSSAMDPVKIMQRIIISPSQRIIKNKPLAFSQVLRILMERNLVNLRRAPRLLLCRAVQIVGTGVVVVIFFTPLKYDSAGSQTRIGIIAQSSSLFFVGMLNAISLYPADLDLFLREHGDGLYGAEVFLTVYTLAELPLEILGALLLSLLVVFATMLSDEAEVYLVIAFTSFAVINCGESLGIIFLSFIRHTPLAISIMSVVLSTCTALNGAFSLNMLGWLQGLNSLSPSKWQVRAAATASLRGITFNCEEDVCTVSSGKQLLELYDLDVSTAKAVGILAAVTIGYRLLAYIALKVRCTLFS